MDQTHNFRMTLAYDGTAYGGWQQQLNAVTIQSTLQDALLQLTGIPVKVHGSGRTDRGVHATGQVANFTIPQGWQSPSLMRALNALLPDDIRVLKLQTCAKTFHARRSAVAKEYRYFIWNAEILPPHLRFYRTHIRGKLDVTAMQKSADMLVGKHDFAAYTANPNRHVESTVRELGYLQVRRRGAEIVISARADGFLYKMVRSLAGWLIQVGTGAAAVEETTVMLNSRIRTARVPTAAPTGLFLWRVFYILPGRNPGNI